MTNGVFHCVLCQLEGYLFVEHVWFIADKVDGIYVILY